MLAVGTSMGNQMADVVGTPGRVEDPARVLPPMWSCGRVLALVTETVTLTREEYERLRARPQWYEEEYERKAAEMRRMVNQAHQQIAATMRDIEKLQARVLELEAGNE